MGLWKASVSLPPFSLLPFPCVSCCSASLVLASDNLLDAPILPLPLEEAWLTAYHTNIVLLHRIGLPVARGGMLETEVVHNLIQWASSMTLVEMWGLSTEEACLQLPPSGTRLQAGNVLVEEAV